jgi:hypothetical protein
MAVLHEATAKAAIVYLDHSIVIELPCHAKPAFPGFSEHS